MITTEQQNAVSIAVIQTEVTYLKSGVADLKATNAQQNAKLDNIMSKLDEAKGGWRVLLLLGGAAGSIGAAVTWALSHWKP